MKRLSIATLGLAALILNPFYACSTEREFRFSATAMRDAVEGTWTLELADRSYIFHIEQATEAKQQHSQRSMIGNAHACGNRTLVKSASACLDTSTMPVIVNVSGTMTDGTFMVHGTTFRKGDLVIEIAGQSIRADVMPDGTATVTGSKLTRSSRF